MIEPGDRSVLGRLQGLACAAQAPEAMDFWKSCIAIDPTLADLYLALADALSERSYMGYARESYRRCGVLSPIGHTAFFRLVRLEFRLGMYAECVEIVRQLIRRNVIDGNSMFYMAASLHYMGKNEEARKILKKFDPNATSVGFVSYYLGRIAYAEKNPALAIEHLLRAIKTLNDGGVRLLLNRSIFHNGQDLAAYLENTPFAIANLESAEKNLQEGHLQQATLALRVAIYAAPWSLQVDRMFDDLCQALHERISFSDNATERTTLWHVLESMDAEREFAKSAILPAPKAGVLLKKPRRVFDGFIFNDELDLLEYRLREIGENIDAMVIVESEWTFQGKPKPLVFQENKKRFMRYADKIIHVPVHEYCAGLAWDQEAYQRNMILRGLKECRDDDMIIVSDVDEIPRRSIVKFLKTNEHKHNDIAGLSFRYFRFFLNARLPLMWTRPVALPYGLLKLIGPNRARELMIKSESPIVDLIYDAGWHFSSLGGIEAELKKYQENSHIEITERQPTREELQKAYGSGRLGNEWGNLRFERIDASFPEFVVTNREALVEKGWIWPIA